MLLAALRIAASRKQPEWADMPPAQALALSLWRSCAPHQAARWQWRVQMTRGGVAVASPGATSAHMTQLIMPQHANSLGITFGGQVSSSPSNLVKA